VARRINEVLSGPISIRRHKVAVGASIGIAVYPGDGNTPDLLLRNADAAMYAAKEAGRGGFAFYAPKMNARYTERLALEAMLHKATSENEFVVYYQPRISARTEKLVGVEALLRWRHPRLGILPPSGFMAVLEDTGLILRVGTWVLFEACQQARRWMESGTPLRVSVNVSARQFRHERFVELVQKALTDTRLDPELLELELTESLLMDDSEQAVALMKTIRRLGVMLSIDDFGTGYSSLSYLARLPVDFLKIDRSFVVNALSSERDDAVISSIAVLARSLGIGVVAEGVEDARQALFLRTMGCSELQGHLFGEARPAEELDFTSPRFAGASASALPLASVAGEGDMESDDMRPAELPFQMRG
jgi:EAL domain-containing protein (putative c-di-GMP-specific phosphodiesterase class I)